MIRKMKDWVKSHKIITIVIVLVVILIVCIIFFQNRVNSEVSYTNQIVKRGDVTTMVTGTGQVEASDTIDIKPKISGDVTYIGVKIGQEIKAGQLIASLDAREAKIDLENAELSLKELTDDPDNSTLVQKENAVAKAYNDGWGTAFSSIIGISTILDDLEDTYNGYLSSTNVTLLGKSGKNKAELASISYHEARNNFKELNKFYKSITGPNEKEKVSELIQRTEVTSRLMMIAVKDAKELFDYIVNEKDDQDNTDAISVRDDLASWQTSTNSYVNNLLSADNAIIESVADLDDLIEGSDEIDIKSAELTLQSKKNDYNDHFIRAPIDGVIADLTASVGDNVSSSIGTLITKQKIVSISLNEVDIASVAIDQKVSLTFDAIDDLVLNGKVAEIDSVGTVNSGVVTYGVKITFDGGDDRVKPGMSTNVEITTAYKRDVLIVENNVIKTKNNLSYVEVFDGTGNITRKEVKTGISDDTLTEIISGLNEGDEIISKTVTSGSGTTTSKNNTGPSGMPIGGAVMGGMMR